MRTENEELYRKYMQGKGTIPTNSETAKALYEAYQAEQKVGDMYKANDADYQQANEVLERNQIRDNQKVLSLQDIAMKYLPHFTRGGAKLGVSDNPTKIQERYSQSINDVDTAYSNMRKDVYSQYRKQIDALDEYSRPLQEQATLNEAAIGQANFDYVKNAIEQMKKQGKTSEEIYAILKKYANEDFGGNRTEYNDLLKQYKALLKEDKEVKASVEKGRNGFLDWLSKLGYYLGKR